MKFTRAIASYILIVGLLAGNAAMAQDGTVTLQQKAEQWEVTVDDNGNEQRRLVPVTRAVPGEEIVYTNTYANVGDEPAAAIKITNPVPEHTDYVAGSASGEDASVSFSVDGGITFGPADELTVVAEDGTERAATPADFTHVRWTLNSEIGPGENGAVQFAAVVE